ncbi:MAG: hypothetical protein LKK08_06310 [Bacteroidales bacterium]|jgi:hypothetical protein|nr:hypothetical protein [Bacteroidales bacterium]
MSIKDYIKGRFKSFGIYLSEADLLDMCLPLGLDTATNVTADNLDTVRKAVCLFIPSLLARPASIGEGSVSMSWDKAALKSYYGSLCSDLGIEDKLNPSVTFLHRL